IHATADPTCARRGEACLRPLPRAKGEDKIRPYNDLFPAARRAETRLPPTMPRMPSLLDTPYPVTDEQIARYQRDGFISFSNILHGPDLTRLRDAVAAAVEDETVPTPRGDAPPELYEEIF